MRQEIYDKVKRHLLTQNAKAMDGPDCCYRSKDGLKCAVGCLIPDSDYSIEMEGWRVAEWAVLKRLPEGYESHLELLKELQAVHDAYEPCEWEEELNRVAVIHGLKP